MKICLLSSTSQQDQAALQKLLESVPSYWTRISGNQPEKNSAAETFKALPNGKSYEDKFVLGLFDAGGTMIGCADLVRDFPDSETAMLGLLVISEAEQKKGYGRLAYKAVQELVLSWPGVRKIRIGVVATNDIVMQFWKSLGFVETGVRRPYEEGNVVSETIVLECVVE